MKNSNVIQIVVTGLYFLSLFPSPLIAESTFFYRDIFPFKEVYSQTVTPEKESRLAYGGVVLEIPKGAVDSRTVIRIIKLPESEPLSDGLTNVTSGAGSWRFEPSGIHFKKNVAVSIPFEKTLLESETALSNLFTYFYNHRRNTWERLPRVRIDKEKGVVVSLTDHFTDMINGTLKLPESPDTLDFNINSIKDLHAADPASGIPTLSGLQPDFAGSASFQIPLMLPPGRGGMAPLLRLSYSSNNVNSWMGRGFDISVPSITTDTRFGLPKYDGNDTYLLDGEELVPVSSTSQYTLYRSRVEKTFKQILHRHNGTDNYWEVTDKSGMVQIFGSAKSGGDGWVGPDRTDNTKTYTWYLTQETDPNGNFVRYSYDYDSTNMYTYLKEIRYSGWTDGTWEEEGKYLIRFVTSTGRPDCRMDGRGKFLSKLIRRLDAVTIAFNGQIFRSYTFIYQQNIFGQTELQSFSEKDGKGNEFYSYGFTYNSLTEVKDTNDTIIGYQGFTAGYNWAEISDSTFPGVAQTRSFGVGASLYAGLKLELMSIKNWRITWSTIFDIGASGGINTSHTLAKSLLMDINGDNLPDALWKEGNQLIAYKNTGSGFDTGSELVFSGIPELMNLCSQKGYSLGASAGLFGATASVTLQRNWTESDTAFADINSDGFTDLLSSNSNSFKMNTGDSFVTVSYGSSGAVVQNSECIDEESYKRVYNLQTPIRKWKAFSSGTIEISQDAELVHPDKVSSDGVRARTIPDSGPDYSIDLLAGNTAGTNNRQFEIRDGAEFYFLMDEGLDSGQNYGKEYRGDDLTWNIDIRYHSINYFEKMKEAAVITPQGAGKRDSEILDHGWFIPVRIPEACFSRLIDHASAATVTESSVIPGGKAKLLDGYRYRPEFNDFLRIDTTGDSTIEPLLTAVLSKTEREDLFYYTDFSGKRVHPESENNVFFFTKEAPEKILPAVLKTDFVSPVPGTQLFTRDIFLDSVKGPSGEAGYETLTLSRDGQIPQLLMEKGGEQEVISDAEIEETSDTLTVQFIRDGIEHIYTLSDPTSVLKEVPLDKYDGIILEKESTEYTFSYPDYHVLNPNEYDILRGAAGAEDKIFIEEVYHPYPEDSEIERYDLDPELTGAQHTRLFLLLDRLSDDPGSVLDKPFLSENEGSVGIIALSEDEFNTFPDTLKIKDLFAEETSSEGEIWYICKENLSVEQKSLLETAEKKFIRDYIEFPYYTFDETSQTYILKESLREEDKAVITTLFSSLGWSVFTRLNIRLQYFSNAELPVFYDDRLNPEMIDNPVPEGASPLAHHNAGAVTIPSFDAQGNSIILKRFIHRFNSASDYRPENLIEYPQDIYNEENTKGTNISAQTDATHVPESFEMFGGGVGGWYYGSWSSYYEFDKDLLHRIPPAPEGDTNEVKLPKYFQAMLQNVKDTDGSIDVPVVGKPVDGDTGVLHLTANSMIGGKSSYTDSMFDQYGNPVNTTYTFASVIDRELLHADRKGGDTYAAIPRGSSALSGGKIGKVRAGRSETTDVNGGIAIPNLQNTGTGLSFSKNSGVSWQNQGLLDMDGDRYPDLVSYKEDKEGVECFSVIKGTGAGFGEAEFYTTAGKEHFSYFKNTIYGFGAAPGEGLGAIVQRYNPKGRTESSSISAPADTSAASFGISGFNGTAGSSYQTEGFLDVTGDGLPDRIKRDGSGTYIIAVNKGNREFGAGISFGDGIQEPFYTLPSGTEDIGNQALGIRYSNSGSLGTGGALTVPGAGIVKGASLTIGFNASANRTLSCLMDINGDGLTDQVSKAPGESYFRVKFNLGDRFTDNELKIFKPDWEYGTFADAKGFIETLLSSAGQPFNSLEIPFIDKSRIPGFSSLPHSSTSPFLSIINPLGVDDVLHYTGGISINLGANVSLQWGIDAGIARFGFVLIPGINGFSAVSTTSLSMEDINGDGLPDQVLKKSGDTAIRTELNVMGQAGLLREIKLPAGGRIVLAYEREGNTVDMPQSRYVLSKVTRSDGYEANPAMSGVHRYSENYTYSGGYYDRGERKFYGFKEVAVIKADGSVVTTRYYNRNYTLKGMVERRTLTNAGGKVFQEKTNSYQTRYLGSSGIKEADAPLLVEEVMRMYDPAAESYIQIKKEYTYDSYGNIITLNDLGLETAASDDIHLAITYRDPGNKYFAHLPEQVLVTDYTGKVLRRREGTYDGRGNLAELKTYYSENGSSDYTFAYDTYGNILKVEDPLGFTKRYTYDGVVNQYVTGIETYNRIYGGDSYTFHLTYDYRYGVETSSTDINNNTISKTYDNFGRLIEVWSPYDTGSIPAVTYCYWIETFPFKALTKNKIQFNPDDTGTMDTCIIIDGMRRVVTTAKEGEVYRNGESLHGWNKSGKAVYDPKGRVIAQGQTTFEGTETLPVVETSPLRPTLIEYDILDRVTKITLPDGSEIEKEYSVTNNKYMELVRDPNGIVTLSQKDARNNIISLQKTDTEGTILTSASYSYNVLGELEKVLDARGNPVIFTYDLKGRSLTTMSPETGLTQYTYDTADHLIRKVDANLRNKGKMINYLYDTLGRLKKVDYPFMADTIYTYGSSGAEYNRAGRIVRIDDGSGSTENYYGKLGETTKVIKRINRLTPFPETMQAEFSYRFDYQGRMEKITYPDGEEVTYTYNRGGEVQSITGQFGTLKTPYVQQIGYDEYAQRVYMKLGNGVETTYSYDENRRWLKTIHTENSFLTLQNMNYTFDRVGNILSLINNADKYTTEQTYTYDGLYQLTHAEGTFLDREHGYTQWKNNYTQNFTYGITGNMMRKTSTQTKKPGPPGGALTYDNEYSYYSDKPKQAEKIGNMYYLYDSNGNIIEERWGGHSTEGVSGSGEIEKVGLVNVLNRGIGLIRSSADGDEGVYKRNFQWDEENRLISTLDPNNSVEYRYDYAGKRTNKKPLQGSETLYYNSMWLETEEGFSFRANKNIYLGETRIATRLSLEEGNSEDYEKVNTYYYHSDHLGSSTLVTDYEGEVYEGYEYTPYGETWIEKGNDALKKIPYRFNAKELDEETGLYYYGARYLNPKTSRWISSDPAGVELINPAQKGFSISGINWYVYANNNPVKYVDPTGMAEIYADDIHGNPILAWPGRDFKAETHVEIQRNSEKVDSNDTARIKIGNQTLAEYGDVQSEKNYKVPGKQSDSQKYEADLSDPEYPNATLPEGDDYRMTLLSGTPSYDKPMRITSKTAQIPGLGTVGIKTRFAFLAHSKSMINQPVRGAYSWGCQIFGDASYKSFRSTIEGIGFKNGESLPMSILSSSSPLLKGRNF